MPQMRSCLGRGRGLQPWILPAAILLAGLPLFAYAAEASRSDEAARSAARAHFETAHRLIDLREYAGALDEYRAAYLAKPDPAFLFNIGLCHHKLGQNREALDFFHQYLKKAPADDPNRQQVETRIREIEAEMSSVTELPPVGQPAATTAPMTAPAPDPAPASAPSAKSESAAPSPLLPPRPESASAAGTDLTAEPPAQRTAAPQPLYGRWWFWTGIAVVVASGVTATILLSTNHGGMSIPTTPLGNRQVFP
jgi:tetratricopeptide (TPR) repeat protein